MKLFLVSILESLKFDKEASKYDRFVQIESYGA